MTGLECGHRFCTQCWGEYLTTKIIEEGVGQTIACAAHGCDILVDDATVMRLVRDSKVKLKYQHLITNSFVEVSYIFKLVLTLVWWSNTVCELSWRERLSTSECENRCKMLYWCLLMFELDQVDCNIRCPKRCISLFFRVRWHSHRLCISMQISHTSNRYMSIGIEFS